MTFVNRNDIVAHGRSMSQRIRLRFRTFLFETDPNGIFTMIIRKEGAVQATLRLTTTDFGLRVNGSVSKSAMVLYKRVGNFFRFVDHEELPNIVKFGALARNQGEAARAEREINKLLILHLYRSRETRLSMA